MKKFINIFLGFVSVSSLIFAIYTYNSSKVDKDPVFIVDPIKTEILNTSSTKIAPIIITTIEGKIIDSDLTSMTFYFWNKGKKPIFKEDLLSEFLFQLDTLGNIIDFSVLKKSRDVCEIKLVQIDKRTLEFDFIVLEQDDGFTAQIIFEGNKESLLMAYAEIIGVREISNKYSSSLSRIGTIVLKVFLGIIAIIAFIIFDYIIKPPKPHEMELILGSPLMHDNEEYKKKAKEFELIDDQREKVKLELVKQRNDNDIQPDKKNKIRKHILTLVGLIIAISVMAFSISYIFDISNSNQVDIPSTIRPYIND